MIDTLSLKNFKAFKHLDNLKLKPITILCGTNSSGKSSILQSILLLKQNFESQNTDKVILLNGKLVELGSITDLIHNKKNDKYLELNGEIILNENERNSLKSLFQKLPLKRGNDIYTINYKMVIGVQRNALNPLYKNPTINELLIELNSVSIKNNQKYKSGVVQLNSTNGYSFFVKTQVYNEDLGKEPLIQSGSTVIKFANLLPFTIRITTIDNPTSSMFLFGLKNLFQTIFEKYNYIGPLRQEPHREYIFRNEISEIGTKGENAAYFYWMEREKLIENHYFYNATKDKFDLKNETTLLEAVRYWLDLMGIQNFKPLLINGIIYLELDSATGEGIKVSLADVGFGVSQIFPIVLEGLRMNKGNTLILEQPEIHLHPKLQMQMADFFVSMALSEKRVLVETHSDHVVNRLVRRIVEDEEHDLESLIGIYFIKPSEDGAIYEEVKIDSEKGIVNWPEGFFDQTATEQEKIIKAGLKKRMAKRKAKTNN